MSAAGDEAGFTLIEVLVALAILSFGLSAVLQSVAAALDGSARASEVVRATQEAQSRLAALGFDGRSPVGRTEGYGGAGGWAVDVTPAADGMVLVTVTVTGRRSSVQLTTLRPMAAR